jgi:hypothetical protein
MMNILRRERLVDELVEAYIDWRESCTRVNDAYWAWASETGPRGRVTFGLYMATLDEEEQAADVYARIVMRADELPSSEDPPAEPLDRRAPGVGWQ